MFAQKRIVKNFFKMMFLCFVVNVYGQLNGDVASFNYTISPSGSDDVHMESKNFRFNIPIRLKKGVLMNSLSYDYYNISNNQEGFEISDLEHFHRINYNLSYLFGSKNNWRFALRTGLSTSSNFSESLSHDDIQLTGSFTAIKTYRNESNASRLMFGLAYTTQIGRRLVLPIIRYYHEINSKLSYAIGFPMTQIDYKFTTKHKLSLSARINGFYANLSKDIAVNSNDLATGVSFRTGLLGASYDYRMDNVWSIYFKTEYAFYNNYDLVNGDGNSVHDYQLSSNLYFSTGVKLNLINNYKKKNNDKN